MKSGLRVKRTAAVFVICCGIYGLWRCAWQGGRQPIPEAADEVMETEGLAEGSEEIMPEACALYGMHSSWREYDGNNSIGVLNLASGQLSELDIKPERGFWSWGKKSNEISENMISDGEGRFCRFLLIKDRGICNLNLSWEKESAFRSEEMMSGLCGDCYKILGEAGSVAGKEEGDCPFALVDFSSGGLYFLNGNVSARFIGDYYVMISYGEREIDVVAIYTPA